MTLYKTLTRIGALLACMSVFAGTALAGDGAPGKSEEAPGQEKKAEQAAPAAQPVAPPASPGNSAAAPGQEKKPEQPAKAAPAKGKSAQAPAKKKSSTTEKSSNSKSYKVGSVGANEKKPDQIHKHTICHATGSASNPFVRITPSLSGVVHGHLGHQDGRDIVPPYVYKGVSYAGQNWTAAGQAIFANLCAAPATQSPAAQTEEQRQDEQVTCPQTVTVTTTVLGGVWHATGSAKNPLVWIQPSKLSAHYDRAKHPDDIIVEDSVTTVTRQVSGATCEQGTAAQQNVVVSTQTPAPPTAFVQAQATAQAAAASPEAAAAAAAPAGGVLGQQAALTAKPAGGVLGEVASIGRTAASGTLPFTGLPLWIAALAGAVLLAAGLTLRRRGLQR